MSERLYRDEVGAAVERLRQLEEENAQLRAELERLEAPKRPPPHMDRGRGALSAVVLVALMLVMVGGLLVRTTTCHRARSRRAHAVASQRTWKTIDTRSRARGVGPDLTEIRGGDDCSIPYFYDSNGVRRYKASCL